jgi:hypothetical protein
MREMNDIRTTTADPKRTPKGEIRHETDKQKAATKQGMDWSADSPARDSGAVRSTAISRAEPVCRFGGLPHAWR